ncbi:MAG: adenylate/guanylate cyclase domain-containing protein [Desulfobacterales bacterium]|jgi:adenylate cyclase
MAEEGFKRKLTAILSADVEGYSRLMAEDEGATVRTLTAYREVFTTLIQQHDGKVLDSPGDNLLAEFVSVVDAVQCAVAVQKEIKSRNDELAENRRMQFRIGINLGDVIQEEERIYGDGVNIAARLEGLADPGGICISKTAFDQIETKLPYGYEFLGDQTVKNIPKPVGAYRVLMEPRVTVAGEPEKEKPAVSRRMPIFIGTFAVLVLAIAVGVWQFYVRRPMVEPASIDKMAFRLPEKPSIAVLPFKNISGDSEQEFLADGITESIIGSISRVSGLFVIASNSVFTYKGKAVKIQTVSEELGVQNVLEGTVQRSDNKLRVNAQLIEATTGRHLWSEKYDRDMEDIFSVQDNISKEILTALQVKLVEGEQARVWAKGTDNIDAYIKFLQAYDHFRSFTKNNMILTRKACQESINIDPNYAAPYTVFGSAHLIDIWFNWTESIQHSMQQAIVAVERAIALDPLSDLPNAVLCHLFLMQRRFDEAVTAGEKAVSLNPNGDLNMVLLAMTLYHIRRYEEAIMLFKNAQRLNPDCPAWYLHNAGITYIHMGRYDEAIAECKRALKKNPNHFPALIIMACAYGLSGQLDEARAVVSQILRINPNIAVENAGRGYKYEADAETLRDGLRKAGLPEKSVS